MNNKTVNATYQEILKLHFMLEEHGIEHDLNRLFDGWQVVYPPGEQRVISAVEHNYSYGNEDDLLEINGLLTPFEETEDMVAGHLTADEVLERILKHHK